MRAMTLAEEAAVLMRELEEVDADVSDLADSFAYLFRKCGAKDLGICRHCKMWVDLLQHKSECVDSEVFSYND